jgi:hypothetical protein
MLVTKTKLKPQICQRKGATSWPASCLNISLVVSILQLGIKLASSKHQQTKTKKIDGILYTNAQ